MYQATGGLEMEANALVEHDVWLSLQLRTVWQTNYLYAKAL